MAHDGNLCIDKRLDHRESLTTAFEFDGLRTCANKCCSIRHRVGNRHVVTHPRHIGDDERRRSCACNCSGVMRHVRNRHLQGVLVTKNNHCDRIANENHVDASSIGHACSGRVVGRDHHQRHIAASDLAALNRWNSDSRAHLEPPAVQCPSATGGCLRRYRSATLTTKMVDLVDRSGLYRLCGQGR
ncbi:unannotated protein [freshwater metagenome]|uniref:Unannotated protein n=1 Tax=freshwater metagenome TaxID=449393 RepID=A0A6J6RZZ7_9ZZZZ